MGCGNCKCCNIEVTRERFLYLLENGRLKSCQTYEVTDIDGFESVFITTTTTGEFEPQGSGLSFLPNYIESGDYQGQYHVSLGAVADGEIYTWGESNYKNESGGALTPDIPSPNVFDTANRFTQLPKSTVNFYTLVDLIVILDKSLNVTWVQHPQKLNSIQYYAITQAHSVGKAKAALAQLNQRNNFGDYIGQNENVVIYNCRVDASSTLGIFENRGTFSSEIYNCLLINEGSITRNVFQAEGLVYNIVGNVSVRKNVIGGSNSRINDISTSNDFYIDILHNELHDNNRLINITGTGESELYIWDNHFHENNDISGWNIDTTFVKFSNSHLNNNVNLTNFTFDDGEDREININFGHNFTITNLSNITINSFSAQFPQDTFTSYDLTGFTTDIVGESVESGKGWFTVTHDFSTDPLNSGSSVLYDFIPVGARLTNCTIIPDSLSGGLGATLRVGLESDDVSYGLAATVLGSISNTVVNTVSNAATANRSLQLTAGVANITGGSVTIKVEFIII